MNSNIVSHAPRRLVALLCALLMGVSLAACGAGSAASPGATGRRATKVSGQFHGAGASSQSVASGAWIDDYQHRNRGAQVAYNPSGSGAGVDTFLTGAIAWAGTDTPLSDEQIAQSQSVCKSGTAFEVPVYLAPIAVMFNLKGISGTDRHLNIDAATLAAIFDGRIANWNDEAIKSQNPKVTLPNEPITVVHRSDRSGTTMNLTGYLRATAGDGWPYEAQESWPNGVGQGAKGSGGVIDAIERTNGSIGYAEAPKAANLGTMSLKVGSDYVAYTPEAAAATADASPVRQMPRSSRRVVVDVDYRTQAKGSYPLVSVSYAVACPAYKDAATGRFVNSWLGYLVSARGQKTAADSTGSAALGGDLTRRAAKSVATIQARG
ncbi:phosphate ABC transporter substrate-binding protein PstS [Bifidobacterium sp. ESL0763]|uniref:phosphate ABC transporter substrate-binding protein PstS n=1 Tax=Bifidobacterium sp. ESL0763 TaxID=2983227 RepID=UPI0023F9E14D|nr:phosphate ABC transporter substrate-binding protein PstS [Bifidobacterium sp. ESL0763]MDF7663409.1 phosphate ABC transporter substrate-binding protein PstS [Bifidobacterium sp. ESL0763]